MSDAQDIRRALVAEQKAYVKNFGERVIGYGHFVSDDGRDTFGTSFFMQLDDRAAADAFVAKEPMSKAGVYSKVDIHRWSNSFGKRAADYRRKGMQQFLCTGPKTGTSEFFREHLHAHEFYFASYGDRSTGFPRPSNKLPCSHCILRTLNHIIYSQLLVLD